MISAWIPALLAGTAITLWPTQHPTNTHPNHIPTSPRHAFTAWKKQRHRDSHTGIEKDLLNVVEALSGALRAGLPPAAALALAREGITGKLGDALTTVEHRARMGEGLAAGWSEAARRINNPELALLARAWSLSEETGTPLAEAAHTATRVLRDRRDQRERTRSAIAGAKATMTLLTLLPATGPLLGLLLGVDLLHVYSTTPLVWAALAAGIILILIGRTWVNHLITHTLAGPVLT
ncbi:Flp pilus assembly protein TadB [Dermatophilus congolensis]|uniref:Flp pilus assembly protein TadB n=1 Tax=Dermatophilus congolensis TaxID=1863 RepID=A0AA46H1M0_9MICO|nr:type II secretion system F family protein [Dermatophilus congolensis]STD15785.1 Flp pilus assembly protein TadB [Dermatophilus congolensis]